ncbi:M14 family metallocarboxypeptidase [Paenibacillus sp. GbtcB18]|uniref:M14 family metallopeptidase n=1 Tax=Paenibacillus sp. GbtcB18 TaxID=2824763 RepID=UPI001C30A291|nr:M14 family metallocarboxypeptidase [Paenibacillus sp. GbtcB18]
MPNKIRGMLLVVFALVPFLFAAAAHAAETTDIVNPNQTYTYEQMTEDIRQLAKSYPELIEYKSIGKTRYGREIWAVRLGTGDAKVLVNASHHAREWMTTNLVMNMIDQYAQLYVRNGAMNGRALQSVLNNTSIWFVPMVNPDGVTLQQKGVSAFPSEARAGLLAMNEKSSDFSRWKANAEGIDLNRQYPAEWKSIRNDSGRPYYKNFKGDEPLQTAETKAMVAFTKEVDPDMELSYHSSGSILYWNFHTLDKNLERDRKIMAQVAAMTGYTPVKPESNPSGGGFTDWFIQSLGRPGLTPEIGRYAGEGSLPLSEFPRIWTENRELGLFAAQQGFELWKERIPVEYKSFDLILTEPLPLYSEADSRNKTGASLTAQPLKADARLGNWFRVDTWLGKSWIHVNKPLLGKIEVKESKIELTGNTRMYREPRLSSGILSELSPQTVTAFEQMEDWYHIRTWLGDAWVQVK